MRKTVLHIITGLGSGGAERMLSRMVLADHGGGASYHVVVVLMDEGLYGKPLREAGIELHCLDMRRGVPSLRALWRLIKILRQHRPDAVMTWLYHAAMIGTLAAVISALGTKRLIWNLRGADIDFARSSFMTRCVVQGLAVLSPLPAVIAANSKAGLTYHADIGYRAKRWAYLPNGFDLREWRPDKADRSAVRTEWDFGDQITVVGVVARVDPQKDYPTFLAAAEKLCEGRDQLRFVLIGKDTEFLSLPESLKLRTLLLGERGDVQKLLRGFDIAALPSAFGEGFPNVVGEAMATGLPCVVTDVGDAGAIVGDTGLIVKTGSPEALAEALAQLIDEPLEKRHRRGEAARMRIEDNYSLASIATRYRALWFSVMR